MPKTLLHTKNYSYLIIYHTLKIQYYVSPFTDEDVSSEKVRVLLKIVMDLYGRDKNKKQVGLTSNL